MNNSGLVKFTLTAGATALIATMVIVVLSVIGRHIRVPLPGSVEIVELLIVIVASISILYATIINSHASARLFIDRLSPSLKRRVEKFGLAMGCIFLLGLAAGNSWIIYDYWNLHEASHLLEIPIIPFRILLVICLLLATFFLVKRIFNYSSKENNSDEASND